MVNVFCRCKLIGPHYVSRILDLQLCLKQILLLANVRCLKKKKYLQTMLRLLAGVTRCLSNEIIIQIMNNQLSIHTSKFQEYISQVVSEIVP